MGSYPLYFDSLSLFGISRNIYDTRQSMWLELWVWTTAGENYLIYYHVNIIKNVTTHSDKFLFKDLNILDFLFSASDNISYQY